MGSIYNLSELCEHLGAEPVAEAAYLAHSRWGEAALDYLRGGFAVHRLSRSRPTPAPGAGSSGSTGTVPARSRRAPGVWLRSAGCLAAPSLRRRRQTRRHSGAGSGMQPLRGAHALCRYSPARGRTPPHCGSGGRQERTYWSPSYRPPLGAAGLEIAAEAAGPGLRSGSAHLAIDRIGGGRQWSALWSAVTTTAGWQWPRGRHHFWVLGGVSDERPWRTVTSSRLVAESLSAAVGWAGGGRRDRRALEVLWRALESSPGWAGVGGGAALVETNGLGGHAVVLDGQGGDALFRQLLLPSRGRPRALGAVGGCGAAYTPAFREPTGGALAWAAASAWALRDTARPPTGSTRRCAAPRACSPCPGLHERERSAHPRGQRRGARVGQGIIRASLVARSPVDAARAPRGDRPRRLRSAAR